MTDTRKTETICVSGSVPVRVVGRVEANDSLYASPDHPGFAVSERELSRGKYHELALKNGFIGTAAQMTVSLEFFLFFSMVEIT